MSHPLHNPYTSGNQSSTQEQYGPPSIQAERDPHGASHLGLGSSFSSSRDSSAISCNSGGIHPLLISQSMNYTSEQSRAIMDEDIERSIDMHISRPREEVRALREPMRQPIDQDYCFTSTQRDEFHSSGTGLASYPKSSTSATLGHRHSDVESGSSSLDLLSNYKRPTADDSKFYSSSVSSNFASVSDERLNVSSRRDHDMQSISGLDDYDNPVQDKPAAPTESSRPKYTSESASDILNHFGLEKEDLELLLSYPEDQITPVTLPFILRQIRLQKGKRATTAEHPKPYPEPQPTRSMSAMDSHSLSSSGGGGICREKKSSAVLQPCKVIDYGHGKYSGGVGDDIGSTSDSRANSGRSGSMLLMDTSNRHSGEPLRKNTTEIKSSALGSSRGQTRSVTSPSISHASMLKSVAPPSHEETKQLQIQPNQTSPTIPSSLSLPKKDSDSDIRLLKSEDFIPVLAKEPEADSQSVLKTQPSLTLLRSVHPSRPGLVLFDSNNTHRKKDQSKTQVQGSTVAEQMKKRQTQQQMQKQPMQQMQKQPVQQIQKQLMQQMQYQLDSQTGQVICPPFFSGKNTVPPAPLIPSGTDASQALHRPVFTPSDHHPSIISPVLPQPVPPLMRLDHKTLPTSNRQPPAKEAVSKGLPVPTMMQDYAAASPRHFPHTCSLCNKECTNTKDLLHHQSTSLYLFNGTPLQKQYPDWDGEKALRPRAAGKDAKPSPSTSAQTSPHCHQKTGHGSRSRSRSSSPCRHSGSEGRREKRSSRSQSPHSSRYTHRSRSRSRSPRSDRPTSSRYRSRSRSPERREASPRRRDEKRTSPRRRDEKWSSRRRSDDKRSQPRRDDERRSPPRRGDESRRTRDKRRLFTEGLSLKQKKSSNTERLAKKLLETSAVQSLEKQPNLEAVVKTLAPALLAELAEMESSSSAKKALTSEPWKPKPSLQKSKSGKSSAPTMLRLHGIHNYLSYNDVSTAVNHFGKTKSLIIFRSKMEAVVCFEKAEDAKKLMSAKSFSVKAVPVTVTVHREKETVSEEQQKPPQDKPATSSVSAPQTTKSTTTKSVPLPTPNMPPLEVPLPAVAKKASTDKFTNQKIAAKGSVKGLTAVTRTKVLVSKAKNVLTKQIAKMIKTGKLPAKGAVKKAAVQQVLTSKAATASTTQKSKSPVDKLAAVKAVAKEKDEETAALTMSVPSKSTASENQPDVGNSKPKESEEKVQEAVVVPKDTASVVETANVKVFELKHQAKVDKSNDAEDTEPMQLGDTGVEVVEAMEVGSYADGTGEKPTATEAVPENSADKLSDSQAPTSTVETWPTETSVRALQHIQQSTRSEPESPKQKPMSEKSEASAKESVVVQKEIGKEIFTEAKVLVSKTETASAVQKLKTPADKLAAEGAVAEEKVEVTAANAVRVPSKSTTSENCSDVEISKPEESETKVQEVVVVPKDTAEVVETANVTYFQPEHQEKLDKANNAEVFEPVKLGETEHEVAKPMEVGNGAEGKGKKITSAEAVSEKSADKRSDSQPQTSTVEAQATDVSVKALLHVQQSTLSEPESSKHKHILEKSETSAGGSVVVMKETAKVDQSANRTVAEPTKDKEIVTEAEVLASKVETTSTTQKPKTPAAVGDVSKEKVEVTAAKALSVPSKSSASENRPDVEISKPKESETKVQEAVIVPKDAADVSEPNHQEKLDTANDAELVEPMQLGETGAEVAEPMEVVSCAEGKGKTPTTTEAVSENSADKPSDSQPPTSTVETQPTDISVKAFLHVQQNTFSQPESTKQKHVSKKSETSAGESVVVLKETVKVDQSANRTVTEPTKGKEIVTEAKVLASKVEMASALQKPKTPAADKLAAAVTPLTIGEMVEKHLNPNRINCFKWKTSPSPELEGKTLLLVTKLPNYSDVHYSEEDVAKRLRPFGFQHKDDTIYVVPQACMAFVQMPAVHNVREIMSISAKIGIGFKQRKPCFHVVADDIAMTPLGFYKSLMKLMNAPVEDDGARTFFITNISNMVKAKDLREALKKVCSVRNYLPLLNKVFIEFESLYDADQFEVWFSLLTPTPGYKVHRLTKPLKEQMDATSAKDASVTTEPTAVVVNEQLQAASTSSSTAVGEMVAKHLDPHRIGPVTAMKTKTAAASAKDASVTTEPTAAATSKRLQAASTPYSTAVNPLTPGEMIQDRLYPKRISCYNRQKYLSRWYFYSDKKQLLITGLPKCGYYTEEYIANLLRPFGFDHVEDSIHVIPQACMAFVVMPTAENVYNLINATRERCTYFTGSNLSFHVVANCIPMTPIQFYRSLMKLVKLYVPGDGLKTVLIKNISQSEAWHLRETLKTINNYLPLLNKVFIEFESVHDADQFGVWHSLLKQGPGYEVYRLGTPHGPSPTQKFPASTLPVSMDFVAGATMTPKQFGIPQDSVAPFWLTMRSSPFVFPTASPTFIIPDYLTVRDWSSIKMALQCSPMFRTIMLTGLPEKGYKHEDVAKLVWRYILKKNLHSLYYNVMVLPLQKRAFVHFAGSTSCSNFIQDHITKPVSVKGCKLSVHILLQHMKPECCEEMMYRTLMKLSNAGVPESKSLKERLLCVEIYETSLDVIMMVMGMVASTATFLSYLPLANRICIEMADSSGVTQVVEKYKTFSPDSVAKRTVWSKVGRFESLQSLKQRLLVSRETTINFGQENIKVGAKPSTGKCQTKTPSEPLDNGTKPALQTSDPAGSTISGPITAGPSASAASDVTMEDGEKPGTQVAMDSSLGPQANEDVEKEKEEEGPLTPSVSTAETNTVNVEAKPPSGKCQTKTLCKLDNGTKPALQTSDPAGSTISDLITAGPSASAASDVTKEDGEKPGSKISMDSSLGPQANEDLEKVKGEERSLTSSVSTAERNAIIEAKRPAGKCQTQPPPSEPLDNGTKPALQTSDPAGSTISWPITAGPSASAASNLAVEEDGEKPETEIAMDSSLGPRANEDVEKEKGEEGPLTPSISTAEPDTINVEAKPPSGKCQTKTPSEPLDNGTKPALQTSDPAGSTISDLITAGPSASAASDVTKEDGEKPGSKISMDSSLGPQANEDLEKVKGEEGSLTSSVSTAEPNAINVEAKRPAGNCLTQPPPSEPLNNGSKPALQTSDPAGSTISGAITAGPSATATSNVAVEEDSEKTETEIAMDSSLGPRANEDVEKEKGEEGPLTPSVSTADSNTISVEAKPPTVKCKTKTPSEPLDNGTKPSLQNSDPAGSTIFGPITAGPSATATSNVTVEEYSEKPGTKIAMDSTLGPQANEGLEKVKGEKGPLTTSISTADVTNTVPAVPSPVLSANFGENLADIPYDAYTTLAEMIRQYKRNQATGSQTKEEGQDDFSLSVDEVHFSSDTWQFNEQNLNMDEFVTIDEIGDDVDDTKPEPDSSCSSSSRVRIERQSSGVLSSGKRTSTRSSKDYKSSAYSSSSSSKSTERTNSSNSGFVSPKKSKYSSVPKSPTIPSSSASGTKPPSSSRPRSTESPSSPGQKTQQNKIAFQSKASNTRSSGRSTSSSSAAHEREKITQAATVEETHLEPLKKQARATKGLVAKSDHKVSVESIAAKTVVSKTKIKTSSKMHPPPKGHSVELSQAQSQDIDFNVSTPEDQKKKKQEGKKDDVDKYTEKEVEEEEDENCQILDSLDDQSDHQMDDGDQDSSSDTQQTEPEEGYPVMDSVDDEGKAHSGEYNEMDLDSSFQILDSVTNDQAAASQEDSHLVQDGHSTVKRLSVEHTIPVVNKSGDANVMGKDQDTNSKDTGSKQAPVDKEDGEKIKQKEQEVKGKVLAVESSKDVENPDGQIPNEDQQPQRSWKPMVTETELETDNKEKKTKNGEGTVRKDGVPSERVDPTTTASTSEEKAKSPRKQDRTVRKYETRTKIDTSAGVSENQKEFKEATKEILYETKDSVEDKPAQDAASTERPGRRQSARGKKDDKITLNLTKASEKRLKDEAAANEILDSVETRTRSRSQQEKTKKEDTPIRTRHSAARDSQKQNKENTPKKEAKTSPKQPTPTKKSDTSKTSVTLNEADNDEEEKKLDEKQTKKTSRTAKCKHDDTEESTNFEAGDEVEEEEKKKAATTRTKGGAKKRTRQSPVRKSTRAKKVSTKDEREEEDKDEPADVLPPTSLIPSSSLDKDPSMLSSDGQSEVQKTEVEVEVEAASQADVDAASAGQELQPEEEREGRGRTDIKAVSKQRREPVGPEAKRSRSQSPRVSADFKLPPFKPNELLDEEILVPGFFCNICSDFCESTARELHCSSQRHYDNLQKHYQKLDQKPSRSSTPSSQGSVSK